MSNELTSKGEIGMGLLQDQIVVVTPRDRKAGPPTPGMDRQQAFVSDGIWAGLVRTAPGMVSGWHHHGDYDTVIYVLTGSLRMEFGPHGSRVVEAGPGDFVYVPKGVVHREGNPSAEPADLIGVRAGRGDSICNVDGPGRT
ncbi:MAG TPA: cupin domain-containing protein [Actinomycetes bacterium]|nr:cupin domain-containing protein [Actinomycetes bacterium]